MGTEKSYSFTVCNLEEMITAAGILDSDDRAYVTGAQLKESLVSVIGIKNEVEQSHKILTEMGIPDLGKGTHGLLKRIEFMKTNGEWKFNPNKLYQKDDNE